MNGAELLELSFHRDEFLAFRKRFNTWFFSGYGILLLGFIAIGWFEAAGMMALQLGTGLIRERHVFARVQDGTFGQCLDDLYLWRQYARFRHKAPGRWLNRD